ncbi:LamG domain-containing protein [Pollutibacter soli]|uniref:LamG domain-containing protein n=1 Tax=Pollutibacter soli TaxID=3034157 RepID=UPI0030131F83
MKKINRILAVALVVSLMVTGCYKEFDPKSYQPPLSIGGYTSSDEIAPNNLVGWFPFDGDYADKVSNTAGTNVGTSFTNGFKGQAMQGALDAYVTFNPTAAIADMKSFTITYWVNSPVNTAGIVGLVNISHKTEFWGNIDMFFENGSTQDAAKFRAHVRNGTTDTWVAKDGIPAVFDNWTNLALTYDAGSSTFNFYVNGSPSASSTAAGFGDISFKEIGPMVFGTVQFQTTPSLTSATGKQPWASYLTGALDEVRIYNTALSASDVSALVKLEGRGK